MGLLFIDGNQAVAMGAIHSGCRFFASYPITPASDILHELARYRHFGVKTFQAEDEIAAISSAIGASFAGMLGVTTTSGPGFVLKQEALGLAVMTELPLVVVDVQRGGPSTGMPTKIEQGDLLMALYGRNSDCPVAIGTSIATRASDAISSRTADVMMPIAAFDFCRPKLLSETIVNDTAVAVIVRPHMIEIFGSPQ